MEEFTQKQPQPDEVILDQSAKLTVSPIHDPGKIQAEQTSAEIGNAQANGPAIANFEGDIEATSAHAEHIPERTADQRATELLALHKTANPPAKSRKNLVSIIVVCLMIGMLLFFLLWR